MPKKQFEKIKQLGIEKEILTKESPFRIEQKLKSKGIEISDDTIRKYRESVYSGIIEITPELRLRLNKLVSNNIELLEKTYVLFVKNLEEINNKGNILEEYYKNPQIIKLLNTIANYLDKIIRLNSSLSPSKAIDIELIKKQQRKVYKFDNI